MTKRNLFFVFILVLHTLLKAQSGWTPISNFGSNPGNLNMYSYTPAGITSSAPLVVVMHGCTQNATTYATQSGWNKLADTHKFYVVYPEQVSANNSNTCFNWFLSGDQDRGQGEALSIKQMVDYMKAQHTIDTTKIFVTGLSAGACMTNVMLACYPDVFSKGAVMAGVAYKSATTALGATNALYGFVTNTPQNWGGLVSSQLPNYTGAYPKVAVFHGSNDFVVNPSNVTEIVKQWTYIHSTDQTADNTITSFNGNPFVTKKIYNNSAGDEVMETYAITGMPHGIAVDTGSCYQEGGKTGTYAYNIPGFHSSFWAANFFNILQPPASITGNTIAVINQNGVTYSVANTANSYTWSVPNGASIISGQGSNSISVNFGSNSGNVTVTEQDINGCKIGPISLPVNLVLPTHVLNTTINNSVDLFPNPAIDNVFIKSNATITLLSIKTILGESVYEKYVDANSYSVDLKNFPVGTYIVSIKDLAGKIITKKLIITEPN